MIDIYRLLYELSSRLAQQCDCLGYDHIDLDLLEKVNEVLGHDHIDLNTLLKTKIPSYTYETHILVSFKKMRFWERVCFPRRNMNPERDSEFIDHLNYDVIDDVSNRKSSEFDFSKTIIAESPWPLDDKKTLCLAQRAFYPYLSTHRFHVVTVSSHARNY